jgi:hypothetical protein
MSNTSWQDEIGRVVWPLQIIIPALVMGCLFFLAVVTFMPPLGPAPLAALMGYVGLGFVLAALIAREIAVRGIVGRGRRRIRAGTFPPLANSPVPGLNSQEFLARTGDAGLLYSVYQARMITGAAILEGAAFLMLSLFMIGRQPWTVALAIALIAGVALHFPTRASVCQWIEQQLRLMSEERDLGPGGAG